MALATALSAGAPSGWSAYRVQPGDTLFELAAARHTTVARVAAANALRNPHHIRIGQVLRLPAGSRSTARRVTTVVRHKVRRGDSVIALARRYRTNPGAIAAANRLHPPYLIRIGDLLRVPVRATRPTSAAAPRSVTVVRYTVRRGDTLSGLAARFATRVATLAGANRLRPPYLIRAGQVLTVATTTAAQRSGARRSFAGRTYPDAQVAQADRIRAMLARTSQPSRSRIRAMITSTARRYGVDPALALAIAKQESGWNQRAVSLAGAIGAMQVMPGTGAWMSEVVGRRLNLLTAHDNITAGVAYLRWLLDRTSDDRDAIAAYYQGLGNVRTHGWFRDTRAYVANVVALRAHYR